MKQNNIYSIVLAGFGYEEIWSLPKAGLAMQFLPTHIGNFLIQDDTSKVIELSNRPLTIISKITLTALALLEHHPEALLLVLSSDEVIYHQNRLIQSVEKAIKLSQDDKIVVLKGNAFMCRVNIFLEEIRKYNNKIITLCEQALKGSIKENNSFKVKEEPLQEFTAITLRNCLIEKTDKILYSTLEPVSSNNNVHEKVNRPWGSYEVLDECDNFKVKRIIVNPNASLSLQMHHHRSEHWVIVKGKAEVTINDSIQVLSENQSTYIPVGAKHRVRNLWEDTLHIIEVQTGTYLGEDDIVRFEDIYGRVNPLNKNIN